MFAAAGCSCAMSWMYCRVQAGSAKSALQERFVLGSRRTNRATMYVTYDSLTLHAGSTALATYASQLASVLQAASNKSIADLHVCAT